MVFLHELERRLPRALPATVQLMGPHGGEGTSTVAGALASCSSRRLGMKALLVRLSEGARPADDEASTTKISWELEELDLLDTFVSDAPARLNEGRYLELVLGPRATAKLRNSRQERERLVETLNPSFDVTWIDSPPAITTNDGILMAPVVHGNVLVVEAEATRQPVAAAAVERIRQSGAEVLGVLFNKRRYYIPDAVYRML